MSKVTIEITKTGWTTTLEIDGKTYVEKHKSTPLGAKAVEGDFEKIDEIPEDLCDELTSFSQFNIMTELQKL